MCSIREVLAQHSCRRRPVVAVNAQVVVHVREAETRAASEPRPAKLQKGGPAVPISGNSGHTERRVSQLSHSKPPLSASPPLRVSQPPRLRLCFRYRSVSHSTLKVDFPNSAPPKARTDQCTPSSCACAVAHTQRHDGRNVDGSEQGEAEPKGMSKAKKAKVKILKKERNYAWRGKEQPWNRGPGAATNVATGVWSAERGETEPKGCRSPKKRSKNRMYFVA